MTRGRKPSPNRALKAQIKKTTTARNKATRLVIKYDREFGALAKKMRVAESKFNVLRAKIQEVKAKFDYAETHREELNADINRLKGML